MRVLHLATTLPWPPDYGGRIVVWNQLRADARHSEVGILAFTDEDPAPEALRRLGEICGVVRTVRRPRGRNGVVGMLRNIFSDTALNLARYRWPIYQAELDSLCREWTPDLLVAHHLHMAPYALQVPGAAAVLREHNVDSQLMKRFATAAANPVTRALAGAQAARIRREEARLAPRFAGCLMITPGDERQLKEIAPTARTTVLPAGIDAAEYSPVPSPTPADRPLVVTAGSLVFPPTADGVRWFVRDVWPRVIARRPDAVFRVIGHCPDGLRAELAAAPGVDVLGRVPEVRPQLIGAHAFVVPLLVGSGLRIKILEALAWELPVISTPIGWEGIEVEPGRHLLSTSDPATMAGGLLEWFAAPADARAVGVAGRLRVLERYSLAALSGQTENVYREIVASRGVPSR